MNLKLNKHYKTLLILALVLGPFVWLMFTADGQRRSDLVMLALFTDREPMNLAFVNLQPEFGEADFRRNLPEIPFQCWDRAEYLGSRVCEAPIAAVNGAPAKKVSLLFSAGALNQVKVVFYPAHREYLRQRLDYDLGSPRGGGSATDVRGERTWDTPYGQVRLYLAPNGDEEPILLWRSKSEQQNSDDGQRRTDN